MASVGIRIKIDADVSGTLTALLDCQRSVVRFDLGMPGLSDEVADVFIVAYHRRAEISGKKRGYERNTLWGPTYLRLEDAAIWLWYGCSWKERLLKRELSTPT